MSGLNTAAAVAALLGLAWVPITAKAQPYTGNYANGNVYQPTPAQVLPLERREGVAAMPSQATADGRMLETIDRDLLRSDGVSTRNVPNMEMQRNQMTAPTSRPNSP
jgi:hypothetical protein